FFRRTDIDFSGLSPSAVLFERRLLATSSIVHLYEAELALRRGEVTVNRQSLLDVVRQFDVEAESVNAERTEGTVGVPHPTGSETTTSDLASVARVLTLT